MLKTGKTEKFVDNFSMLRTSKPFQQLFIKQRKHTLKRILKRFHFNNE